MDNYTRIIIYFVIVAVFLLIRKMVVSKNVALTEQAEESNEESRNIKDVDFMTDVLVTFRYISFGSQFTVHVLPSLTINGTDKYRLINNSLTLKLPSAFSVRFGIPYLNREAFKVTETFRLRTGFRYTITFITKLFFFQKAKIEITLEGLIEEL